MKRKLLPLLLLSLLAALFFALAACGEDGEPASVQSVEITYNGTAVGEDGLTVNLAREAFALDVNVKVTGDCSREATLSSSDTAVASISDTGKRCFCTPRAKRSFPPRPSPTRRRPTRSPLRSNRSNPKSFPSPF